MLIRKGGIVLILTSLVFIWAPLAHAQMILSRSKPASVGDTRQLWYDKLVLMALEATREEYGEYKIVSVPFMRHRRTLVSANENRYENFYFFRDYRDELVESGEIAAIKFPALLGLLSYRVCFYPQLEENNIMARLRDGDLKSFSYGLGNGWSDVKILKYNGFNVKPVADYESLFKMTAANRFDFFCRGVNEVLDEYIYFKRSYAIELDQSFALHYPMPVFFHTNRQNTELVERLHKGFIRIYENGQMQKAFLNYFHERVVFTRLWDRKIHYFENPLIQHIDPNYKQYNIDLSEFSR